MANLLVRRSFDPLRPMFGDWMDDVWNRTGLATMPRYSEMPAVERALMDVVDKGDHFEIKVDMPGVKKEDIEVSVEGAHGAIGSCRPSAMPRCMHVRSSCRRKSARPAPKPATWMGYSRSCCRSVHRCRQRS